MLKRLVSVIIPTYNEEKNIGRCLKSIKSQTYKHIEIIIVDQSSSDKTLEISKKYTSKIIIRPKPKFYSPPAKSRNIGFKHSRGEFLLNIDADMTLPKKLVENCVNIMEKNSRFVGLILHEKDIGLNFWAKCRGLEKQCMVGDPLFEASRFVKRTAFLNIKGYDSNLGSGEDWDLQARLKKIGLIGYSDFYIDHHTGKKYLFKNFLKMKNYGKTFRKYINKHPDLSKKQLTPFRKMYLRNILLLLKHHLLTLGLIILKATEFFGAFIGMLGSKND